MKIVRLNNNIVAELIPDYALPVKDWYGEEFASQCMEAPDAVQQGWVFDAKTNTFSKLPIPTPTPAPPTNEELAKENAELKIQQAQSDDAAIASFEAQAATEAAIITIYEKLGG